MHICTVVEDKVQSLQSERNKYVLKRELNYDSHGAHLTSQSSKQKKTATATLVSAFALSRIDYCNSLLFGSTQDVTSHLPQIKNYAARVILCLPKSSSITIHLKSLHWLPVKVRSTQKIACLCYHCHSSTAPSYVADMLQKKPLHTSNTLSSSYTMPLLNRPAHSKATLGDRSFSFLLLLSGTLFQMMSGVPHHCHHLSLARRHTCFVQFTKTEHYP